ncbi:MAG: hypothetical protein CMG55_06540 [Candidatus Marinimicrobia bacterium]|nr:hypothetical protein [Candidatus Neomarinimicrobiota bacterium]
MLKFLIDDPVNYYSIIHFLEYAFLGLIPAVKSKHVLYISVLWEIIELFIPYSWAQESYINKIFDILFNFSGFYFVRIVFF